MRSADFGGIGVPGSKGDVGVDKVRVGLVGCGVIADVMHLRGIKQMEEMGKVELVAVCDAVEDKAKAAAEKWEVPAHYTDL
jgi:predicted dehydrogenase